MRSLYSILGVPRHATRQEIKRAYYAVAHDCHPDKCPNDEQAAARFRDVSLAYTVLGNSKSRKRYDLLGPVALGLSPSLTDLSMLGAEGEQLAQALGAVMTGMVDRLRRSRQRRAKIIDVHIDVGMALRGGTKQLELPRRVLCHRCQSAQHAQSVLPSRGLAARCQACKGRGSLDEVVSLNLRIPTDSAPGDKLRLAGAGSRGEDVVVRLMIDPHPLVLHRNLDLFVELPICASIAALGGPITVPLPHKNITLVIPSGSQPGDVVQVTDEGLRGGRLRGRGTLHVTLDVEIPRNLDGAGRALWLQLARHEADAADAYGRQQTFNLAMQH